jgi:anti-sigma factor RsiW
MKSFANDHDRAFELSCMLSGETLSEAERGWLEQHLASCTECRENAETSRAAIAALKSVSVTAGSELVQNTQRRVRALCLRNAARQRRMRPIWISSAFASLWMACAAPYLWQSFDWTGHWLHIPDLLWQMGFLVTWFTPALTGAAVAMWLRPQLNHGMRPVGKRAAA